MHCVVDVYTKDEHVRTRRNLAHWGSLDTVYIPRIFFQRLINQPYQHNTRKLIIDFLSFFEFQVLENVYSLLTDIRMVYPSARIVNLEVPEPLHITCEYTGPEEDNVTWFKDGRPIVHQYGFVHSLTKTVTSGRITLISSISKTKSAYEDSGNYSCHVHNTTLAEHVATYAS